LSGRVPKSAGLPNGKPRTGRTVLPTASGRRWGNPREWSEFRRGGWGP
jgi:hypothetical protein